jgi:hypothetical protein
MAHRPFVPIADTVKFELLYSLGGQKLENVINIKLAGTPLIADAVNVAAYIVGWWNTNIAPLTSAAVNLTGIRATNIDSADGFQFEYTTGLPLSGGAVAGQIMPGNVTVAVRLTTDKRGRNYTGRLYHVGLMSGQVAGDLLTGGAVTAIKGAYEALQTGLATVSGQWVVASYWLNKTLRTIGIATPIEGISVDQALDSQRRRLIGRGR